MHSGAERSIVGSSRGEGTVIRLRAAAGIALLVALAFACAKPARWSVGDQPTAEDAGRVLSAHDMNDLTQGFLVSEVPEVPVRQRLRPCCAFGSGLSVRVAVVPLPLFTLANVMGPDDIGEHSYDSGFIGLKPPAGYTPSELAPLEREANGLVYTCRGGFVDTAHVRDYVDWALFLGSSIGRHLEEGATIELPDEGGRRRVVLRPVPADLLDRIGRLRLVAPMAQWITFQLSIWHEIATWYGWASVPGFSERGSSFSPEDLYSNMIGVKMALGIADRRSDRDEHLYNESVDTWLRQVLAYLDAVPKRLGVEAARSVDKLWWDSDARLPDKNLVIRRSFDVEGPIVPWLVPDDRMSETLASGLREQCGDQREPLVLANPAAFQGVAFRDWVTLEIDVDAGIVAQGLPERVTQDDFPGIIGAIRAQNRAEFGPDADRPN